MTFRYRSIVSLLTAILALSGCSGAGLLNALAVNPADVEKDVAYGDLPRQRLDIYHTADDTDAPVLLYFHGGGWQNGSKDDYQFLGAAFAAEGIETVVANHRLYPDVIYPEIIDDVALAIAHTKSDIAKGRALIVMGHSAGAHLAAQALANERFLAAAGTSACETTAGFVGVSGPYDFVLSDDNHKKTFPEAVREDAKPVNHADGYFPPALLLHGSADTTVPVLRSEQFEQALEAAGNAVELKVYEGVNHTDILGAVAPIIRSRAPTFEDVTAFVKDHAKQTEKACQHG